MIWQYDAMLKVQERELEIMDQSQTQVICFEVRSTALRPRLHTEGFPLTRPHRTSHTGNLHWGFGAIIITGSNNSSLNQYNLSLEARHKANTNQPHNRGIGTKPLKYNHLTLEGFQHNLHNHLYTRGIIIQSPHTWGISQMKGLQLGGLFQPQTNLLTKTKIL